MNMRYVCVSGGVHKVFEVLRVNDNRPDREGPSVLYFVDTKREVVCTNATTYAGAAKAYCKKRGFTLIGKVTQVIA